MRYTSVGTYEVTFEIKEYLSDEILEKLDILKKNKVPNKTIIDVINQFAAESDLFDLKPGELFITPSAFSKYVNCKLMIDDEKAGLIERVADFFLEKIGYTSPNSSNEISSTNEIAESSDSTESESDEEQGLIDTNKDLANMQSKLNDLSDKDNRIKELEIENQELKDEIKALKKQIQEIQKHS